MIKKIIAGLLTAVMMFACCAMVFAADDELEILPTDFSVGDVDMDSNINVKDATLVQKHLVSICELSSYQLFLADADIDGNITIKDATYIQKQVAGLIKPALPPESNEETTTVIIETTTLTVEDTTTADVEETSTASDVTEAPSEAVTTPSEVTTFAPTTPTESSTQTTDTPTETPENDPTEPYTGTQSGPVLLPFVPAQ